MVEYALLISHSALASFSNLAHQVNDWAGSVNWMLVGGIVVGLLIARSALKSRRV